MLRRARGERACHSVKRLASRRCERQSSASVLAPRLHLGLRRSGTEPPPRAPRNARSRDSGISRPWRRNGPRPAELDLALGRRCPAERAAPKFSGAAVTRSTNPSNGPPVASPSQLANPDVVASRSAHLAWRRSRAPAAASAAPGSRRRGARSASRCARGSRRTGRAEARRGSGACLFATCRAGRRGSGRARSARSRFARRAAASPSRPPAGRARAARPRVRGEADRVGTERGMPACC